MGIPTDQSLWPEEWKKIEYKEYPRLRRYALPRTSLPGLSLQTTLESRASSRNFLKNAPLSTEEISALLLCSIGEKGAMSRRTYPSAGARYPLEVYFSFSGNTEIPKGIYHYNVREHSLEELLGPVHETELRKMFGTTWNNASGIVILTGLFERSMRKYRERGYRFALLEAGAALQNFYLSSTALGLGFCAIGASLDSQLETILDLNPLDERVIISGAVGRVGKESQHEKE